jgi:hypothetical protein
MTAGSAPNKKAAIIEKKLFRIFDEFLNSVLFLVDVLQDNILQCYLKIKYN